MPAVTEMTVATAVKLMTGNPAESGVGEKERGEGDRQRPNEEKGTGEAAKCVCLPSCGCDFVRVTLVVEIKSGKSGIRSALTVDKITIRASQELRHWKNNFFII